VIEAIFFIGEDGFSAWRANGVVKRSLSELAQVLGVDESEFKVQLDPAQYAEEQKRLHRRPRAYSSDFNLFTGKAD
jgi:hypothetical protein